MTGRLAKLMRESAQWLGNLGRTAGQGAERWPRGVADGLKQVGDGHPAAERQGKSGIERAAGDLTPPSGTSPRQSHATHSSSFGDDKGRAPQPADGLGEVHSADQGDESWRRNPLSLDFTGTATVELPKPNFNGWDGGVLTANTIDRTAQEVLGFRSCHQLAAALHHMTGWPIVTTDRQVKGKWLPDHSAVQTPTGDLLDIFGHRRLDTVMADLEESVAKRGHDGPVRHRVVPVENMPGDVLTDIDHLRGNPLWWAAENSMADIAVYSHFARCVLRDNGYPHLARYTSL